MWGVRMILSSQDEIFLMDGSKNSLYLFPEGINVSNEIVDRSIYRFTPGKQQFQQDCSGHTTSSKHADYCYF